MHNINALETEQFDAWLHTRITCRWPTPEKPISLDESAKFLTHLLARGQDPKKILLITDVDGVITREPIPGLIPSQPRANIVDWLKHLEKIGVNLVASSAWNNYLCPLTNIGFKETLGRLQALGFESVFSLKNQGTHSGLKTIECRSENRINAYYHQNGNCCSVTTDSEFIKSPKGFYSLNRLQNPYFRAKALSPYIVLSESVINSLQYVFFWDDSDSNIRIFQNDVETSDLFPKAKILIYRLSEVENISSEEKINF